MQACRCVLRTQCLDCTITSSSARKRVVVTLPIDKRERSWRYAYGANAADDDAVVITWKHFFDFAIKTGETVHQEGCARQHGRPLSAGVPGGALETIPSGKPDCRTSEHPPQVPRLSRDLRPLPPLRIARVGGVVAGPNIGRWSDRTASRTLSADCSASPRPQQPRTEVARRALPLSWTTNQGISASRSRTHPSACRSAGKGPSLSLR